MPCLRHTLVLSLALLAAACDSGDPSMTLPGDAGSTIPFAGVAENERLRFVGTEPFWSGEAGKNSLTYSTPENQAGEIIPVQRFAGRNGISFSGVYRDQDFVMAVSPGQCSDGMSDRAYPFIATLRVTGETRQGCAWSDKHPFTGSTAP